MIVTKKMPPPCSFNTVTCNPIRLGRKSRGRSTPARPSPHFLLDHIESTLGAKVGLARISIYLSMALGPADNILQQMMAALMLEQAMTSRAMHDVMKTSPRPRGPGSAWRVIKGGEVRGPVLLGEKHTTLTL